MTTPSPQENYEKFKEAYKKALLSNKESFIFKGNYYLTSFAKELLIHNKIKNGKNEKSNDRDQE